MKVLDMHGIFARHSWILLAAACTACTPSTSIQQPLTARPPAATSVATEANGAIFKAGYNDHPLFEDARARRVGDTLIVAIAETTSASENSSSGATSSGSVSVASPSVSGGLLPHALGAPIGQFSISGGGSNVQSATKSTNAGANSYIGTITVTVIEVLPNGNLVVSGEKQVSIRQGSEFIRFSGVVNPVNIVGNSVTSTQVADVHVEYKGVTYIGASDVSSMMAHFFLSLFPF
jgi:flagellar L-ring protein precursor FlgH